MYLPYDGDIVFYNQCKLPQRNAESKNSLVGKSLMLITEKSVCMNRVKKKISQSIISIFTILFEYSNN